MKAAESTDAVWSNGSKGSMQWERGVSGNDGGVQVLILQL